MTITSLDKHKLIPLAVQMFNIVAKDIADNGFKHFIWIKGGMGSINSQGIQLSTDLITPNNIIEKIGEDKKIHLFELGVPEFHSHSKLSSCSSGLSYPVIACETAEDRDMILEILLNDPLLRESPQALVFLDFVDGEIRIPLDNVTQYTIKEAPTQPAYVVLGQ